MALTANKEVSHFIDQELREFQLATNVKIYKGALCSVKSTGYVAPLTAGENFAGLSYELSDNTGGANGAKKVRMYTLGDFELTVSGLATTDIGRPVFANDDATLAFTGSANSYIGVIEGYVAANTAVVRLDPLKKAVKTLTYLQADLGAGADVAATAIGSLPQDAWVIGCAITNGSTAAAGVDAGNTVAVTVSGTAGTIATKTYGAGGFVAANARDSLGAITNGHLPIGDPILLTIVQGATANAGPFTVSLEYV